MGWSTYPPDHVPFSGNKINKGLIRPYQWETNGCLGFLGDEILNIGMIRNHCKDLVLTSKHPGGGVVNPKYDIYDLFQETKRGSRYQLYGCFQILVPL